MRTMASVCFAVIVLILVHTTFGNVCDDENITSCDECIRCGGTWCNQKGGVHCALSQHDEGWCPYNQEKLVTIPAVNTSGDLVSPIYAEQTLNINVSSKIDIHYTARNKQKPKITITNSTRSFEIKVSEYDTKCEGLNCVTTIEAIPGIRFCSNGGGSYEYVNVEVGVGGLSETVILKYHISCACECSQKIDESSLECNTHGDLYCGECSCHPGWTGDDCNTPVCDAVRGDVPCANKDEMGQCYGNGYCGPCGTCICYTDRPGYQYFDQDNDCADICTVVNYCDTCLVNATSGLCNECMSNKLYIQNYNESLLSEKDAHNQTVWINCNETVGDCYVRYVAMKEWNNFHVMVIESCNTVIAGGVHSESKVNIALIVLGLLAAVAAAGGVLYWHHMKGGAVDPENKPGYQNIVPEGSSGQNPLYKDPWSSFKNPMYGDNS